MITYSCYLAGDTHNVRDNYSYFVIKLELEMLFTTTPDPHSTLVE